MARIASGGLAAGIVGTTSAASVSRIVAASFELARVAVTSTFLFSLALIVVTLAGHAADDQDAGQSRSVPSSRAPCFSAQCCETGV